VPVDFVGFMDGATVQVLDDVFPANASFVHAAMERPSKFNHFHKLLQIILCFADMQIANQPAKNTHILFISL
jgi:hypothetical protein